VTFTLVASTNTAQTINLDNGTQGTYSTTAPTLKSVSLANIVPTTAVEVQIFANSQYKGGSTASVLVAPTTAWGGANNGPQGSNGQTYPIYINTTMGAFASISLEANSIAWASSASGGAINLGGWKYPL
jgi:hypothetical protein